MKTMREKLNDKHGKNIIPIWFNAWRCERERNLAIIPLLQLLVSEIKDNKLKKAFIEILKSLQLKFSLPGGVELSAGGVSQNQVEGDLYYAKLDAIETTLRETDKKIVVFIDDLDRCAPDKILEVLESTKVFLAIKGFVYVLGLSPEVVVKAIEQKYKDMGINGEDYLEKIVQIPFRIPDWNVTDRGDFLTDLVDKDKIDPTYKDTIGEYKDIIQEAIERTPRQVKRFINTYICEQEIFKEKELDQTIHLVLTILKFNWYNFYQDLFDDKYRQNLKEILSDENKLREGLKEKKEAKEKEDNQDKRLDLVDFISKPEVREAIKKILDMDYKQLLEYRRVGMIMHQKISESATSREKLIELLIAKKVSEFNALRDRESLEEIDLSGAYFSGAYLRGADLHEANLSGANLREADLSGANLSGANLSGANLREVYFSGANLSGANLSGANLREVYFSGANLSGADLHEANLRGADLHEADLSGANLHEADLIGANLSGGNLREANLSGANLHGANLSGANLIMPDLRKAYLSIDYFFSEDTLSADLRAANLSQGIILIKEPYYQEAKVNDANFEDALINDSGFLEYLRENGAKNVPDEVSTKDEFINEMKKRRLNVGAIEQFFDE